MEQEPKKPQPDHLINMTQDGEEQEWQDLIDSIEATDVPLEMLKYLRVHLRGGTRMIFPIIDWTDEGVEVNKVKDIVKDWYKKNDKNIVGSDFIVNLTKLKETVKTQTNRTLKDL